MMPTDDHAERRRLRALESYRILDTPRESDFDRLAVLASRIAGTPGAVISFVDESRQWFKATYGLEAGENERTNSFCDFVVRMRSPLVVGDATADPRFADNALVTGELHIRFYAGVPLLLDGEALGSLAVLDRVPRELSPEQIDSLQTLARQVTVQLELRRQRVEDASALADLAGRLSQTLDSLTDGFFTLDQEGRFAYVNPAAERMLGRSRDVLLGEKVWHVLDGIVGSVFFTECRRAVKENRTVVFESFYRPTNQWLQITAYPTTEGLAVYSKDVTDRRAMEDALRRSEERFKAIARVTTHTVWDWNLRERIEWLNAGMRVFGYDDAEPRNSAQWWSDQIHPDDAQRVFDSILDALTSDREIWRGEYRFRRKDGSFAYLVDQGVILRDDEGKAVRMVGGARDQTELHAYQEKLAEQAALLDQARDAIIVHDLEHRILYWNEGAERLYGWRAEEVTERPIDQLLYRESSAFRSAVDAVLADGEWFGDIEQCRRDARDMTVECRWTLVRDEAGQPKSILAINTDITDRLEIEEQLRWSQRLEAVGQLTGGVAHDFNNLLTVILGNAELLRDALSDDTRLRGFAEMTHTAAERGADLTRHLLAFARRQRLEPKVTDVDCLLSKMGTLLRHTLGEAVEIEMSQGGGLWSALIDPVQLESAVLNLCINARDAMPGGGRLTIATRNTVLDRNIGSQEVTPGHYVELVISDTGVGMSEEVIERIFEPFFTTKGLGKGSGLGLSMVYGFVKQSGGHIKVASKPKRGTSVKIYLPRAHQEAEGEADDRTSGGELGGTERVLLVEDDALVRTHVAEQLQVLGYHVTAAANGQEALDVLSCSRFDLLFTDVVMPGGLDGRQLAEQARRLDARLRVLFTSGYTEQRITQLEAGTLLLNKPYSRHDLARTVRQALAANPGGDD